MLKDSHDTKCNLQIQEQMQEQRKDLELLDMPTQAAALHDKLLKKEFELKAAKHQLETTQNLRQESMSKLKAKQAELNTLKKSQVSNRHHLNGTCIAHEIRSLICCHASGIAYAIK